jgi:hypothetical protein
LFVQLLPLLGSHVRPPRGASMCRGSGLVPDFEPRNAPRLHHDSTVELQKRDRSRAGQMTLPATAGVLAETVCGCRLPPHGSMTW